MIPGRIADANLRLTSPEGWDKKANGPCGTLWARAIQTSEDGGMITTAWYPTPAELERLQAGAPVYLTISGNSHPPVHLTAGPPPDETMPRPPAPEAPTTQEPT